MRCMPSYHISKGTFSSISIWNYLLVPLWKKSLFKFTEIETSTRNRNKAEDVICLFFPFTFLLALCVFYELIYAKIVSAKQQ